MNKILPKVSAVIIAVIVITGVVSVFMVESGVWTSSTITDTGLLPTYNLTAALSSYQVDIRSGLVPGFTGSIGPVPFTGSPVAYGGTTNYSKIVPNGTTFALTAPATSGSLVFSDWTGCNSFSGRTCTVTINGSPRTVTARYTILKITVNSSGATSVAITGVPSTYSGTTNYTKTLSSVTVIALTAPATKGYAKFSKWTGCDVVSGTGNLTCNVTINAQKTVTAIYIPPTLTVNSIGVNAVAIVGAPTTLSGTTNYTKTPASGTAIALTAPATSGSGNFYRWTGCNSVSARTCNVTLTSIRTVVAEYIDPNYYNLTVNSTGIVGVAVTGAPTTLSGTTHYTKAVAKGTTSTLTAPVTSGSGNFSKWIGCDAVSGTGNRICNLTMKNSRTVTAEYKVTNYTLTVNSIGVNAVAIVGTPTTYSGTTSYTRTVANGTFIVLTAPSSVNSTNFSGWTGCNSIGGTGNRICNVTVKASRTVTTIYGAPPPPSPI